MDIAPHGSYLVAGSSSGMILLFDLSNPSAQTDGLLIGQIRARGMHTNLIVTVKFSEDGRFVFAGVSKGSSEMLAIDLGKVLVDWNSNNVSVINRNSSDELQQLQLSSMVTFTFSDAKLRGFGAVVRMDTPYSERAMTGSSGGGAFRDSSALYRLACGRGIKNVHIWHFRVGYLEQHKPSVDCDLDCMQQQLQQLHGKWEYVCDVASNGNTITHIEFRQGGNELLSKSAGMCIRLWDLQSSSKLFDEATTTTTSTGAAAIDGAATTTTPEGESNDSSMPAAPAPAPESALPTAAPTSTAGYVLLKPSYVDIANSQDVKCMLPVGTGAYGGTYQFAVLNTAAPREANRDVLELPERFSGDASVASSVAIGNPLTSSGGASSSSAFMSAGAGRGRRITREIEQVICTDEGRHALILCADGGVVYYCAPFTTAAAATGPSVSLSNNEQQQQYSVGGPSSDAEEEQSAESATDAAASTAEDTCGGGGGGGGTGQLVEMGTLFRQKDQQQHPGSWALRRVGRQGIVVSRLSVVSVSSANVAIFLNK